MLLERELARIQERPDLAARSVRQNSGPRATEDEGDNLEEELRDVDRLRTEIEDLSEDGGEAGEADAEEVHAESVDGHLRVILERDAASCDVIGGLYRAVEASVRSKSLLRRSS